MAAPFNFTNLSHSIARLPLSRNGGMFDTIASTAMNLNSLPALFGRVASDGQFYDEPEEGADLKALLDSKYTAEKAEGMKRLLALMSGGTDVSEFFPQVVKNIGVRSLHLKRMVYMYLSHYAHKRPDETLLAINTLQKELSDPNALVRAQALRAMAGIRLPAVTTLVLMAAQRCARDVSAYVRQCTAQALPQIYAIDREQHREVLEELVDLLLGDSSVTVLGAAAAAFLAICPHRLHVVGTRFPSLCQQLRDMDEWAHVVVLEILLRYALGKHGAPSGSMGAAALESRSVEAAPRTAGAESVQTPVASRTLEASGGTEGGRNTVWESDEGSSELDSVHGGRAGLRYINQGGSSGIRDEERREAADDNDRLKQAYEDFYADVSVEGPRRSPNRGKWEQNHYAEQDRGYGRFSSGGSRGESRGRARSSGPGSGLCDQPFSSSNGPDRRTHEDVTVLLRSTLPLLRSRNSAVVMAAATVHWHLAERGELRATIVKPLVFLLRTAPDSQYVILANIASMVQALPSLFESQYEDFLIRASDNRAVRSLKLGVLTLLVTEQSLKAILREFQAYVQDTDGQFVAETIRAIGCCASRLPAIGSTCVEGLLQLALGGAARGVQPIRGLHKEAERDSIGPSGSSPRRKGKAPVMEEDVAGVSTGSTYKGSGKEGAEEGGGLAGRWSGKRGGQGDAEEENSRDAVVVREAVLVMRSLIQQRPSEYSQVLVRLVRSLDGIHPPEARAAIVWMVGEHCALGGDLARMAPVVLRHMAGLYLQEEDLTKLQILTSTAKVLLRSDRTADAKAKLLMKYVLDLARYDASYDIRDRARMIRRLLALRGLLNSDGSLAEKDGKEGPASDAKSASQDADLISSLSDTGASEGGVARDWTADLVAGLAGEGGYGGRSGGGRLEEREGGSEGEGDRLRAEAVLGSGIEATLPQEGREPTTSGAPAGEWGSELAEPGQCYGENGYAGKAGCPSRSFLAEAAERLLLPAKLQASMLSLVPARSAFHLGTLSHLVNHRAPGYEPLPEARSVKEEPRRPGEGERAPSAGRRDGSSGDEDEEGDYTESGSSYSSEYTESEDESEKERGYDASGSTRHGRRPVLGLSAAAGNGTERGSVGTSEEPWGRGVDVSQDAGTDADFVHLNRPSTSTRGEDSGMQGARQQMQADSRPLIDLSDGPDGAPASASPSTGPWGTPGPAGQVEASLMDFYGGGPTEGVSEEGLDSLAVGSLEDWLNAPPGGGTSGVGISGRELGEDSSGKVELPLGKLLGRPRRHRLLDFTNGEGLEVDYAFDRLPHRHPKQMVAVRLFFHNRSMEILTGVSVEDVSVGTTTSGDPVTSSSEAPRINESRPFIPPENVPVLGPGQAAESILYVDFRHQLKPIKLAIALKGKAFPVKLTPEVGALLRPEGLGGETFSALEGRLLGLHESRRRCILAGHFPKNRGSDFGALEAACVPFARTAAQKIMDAAHLGLVSASTEPGAVRLMHKWRLRFSGETLATAVPCLLTVANEGAVVEEDDDTWRMSVQVKVNCEDTVFGLSLLKQLDNALSVL